MAAALAAADRQAVGKANMAIHNYLSDADRDHISAAVAAAEKHTSGEIVTVLADRSDGYFDVALVWSAIVAFLALGALTIAPDFYLGLYDKLLGGWEQEWSPQKIFAVATLVAAIKFCAMWLLQLWQPLRFLLIPGRIKSARTRSRAVANFRIGAERRTQGRTGILIYLSMREHRAEIVADEAIASVIAPEVWGDAMAAMLQHIREGRVGDGLVAAVERVGKILAEHLPPAPDDINELPDRLIEV